MDFSFSLGHRSFTWLTEGSWTSKRTMYLFGVQQMLVEVLECRANLCGEEG